MLRLGFPLHSIRLMLGVLAIVCFISIAPSVRAADVPSQYFPQTGHTVSGSFLQYWRSHGGFPVFGYPLTDAKNEVDPETGTTFLTQWFERNRFELHPENAGTQYAVLLGLLGTQLRREAQEVDPDFVRQPRHDGGDWYFVETGHNLGGSFRDYWIANGGLERFGYPISTEHYEVDPETNQAYLVQWFERARFEYHPDNKAPYTILLGLLGKELGVPRPNSVELAWAIGNDDSLVNQATSVAADKTGNVYVVDWNTSRIVRFDTHGNYIMSWTNGTSFGGFPTTTVESVATDKQGNVYVPEMYRNGVIKFSASGRRLLVFDNREESGEEGVLAGHVAVDSLGNIYVSDWNDVIRKFDSTGKFIKRWGGKGSIDGLFNGLGGLRMAFDSHDKLYVTDTYNNRIQVFDSAGTFLAKWGGGTSSLVSHPDGIAIDSHDRVFASDGSTIKEFDTNGVALGGLPTAYDDTGSAFRYYGIAIDGNDTLYATTDKGGQVVYDSGGKIAQQWRNKPREIANLYSVATGTQGRIYALVGSDSYGQNVGRVVVLNATGHLLGGWGSIGSAAGQLKNPSGIATDAVGNVWIADSGNHRIQKFEGDGHFMLSFDIGQAVNMSGIAVGATGNIYIGDSASQRVRVYDSGGTYLRQIGTADSADPYGRRQGGFALPSGIAIGKDGVVYVADGGEPGCSCIQKFDSNGTFLLRWGTQEGGTGQFYAPFAVATDATGNVYVADTKNHRFQKFDADGHFLTKWGTQDSIPGGALFPRGIALDMADNIFVTDGRIQKFVQR